MLYDYALYLKASLLVLLACLCRLFEYKIVVNPQVNLKLVFTMPRTKQFRSNYPPTHRSISEQLYENLFHVSSLERSYLYFYLQFVGVIIRMGYFSNLLKIKNNSINCITFRNKFKNLEIFFRRNLKIRKIRKIIFKYRGLRDPKNWKKYSKCLQNFET